MGRTVTTTVLQWCDKCGLACDVQYIYTIQPASALGGKDPSNVRKQLCLSCITPLVKEASTWNAPAPQEVKS